MGHALDEVAPILAAVVATVALPEGAPLWATIAAPAAAAGVTQTGVDYSKNHNIGPDLLNGLGTAGATAAGDYLGSSLFPTVDAASSALNGTEGTELSPSGGGVINAIGGGTGDTLPQIGGGASGALGSTAGPTAGSGLSTAAGGIQAGGSLSSFLGNSIGTNLGLSQGGTLSGLVGDYAPSLGSTLANTSTGTALGSIAGGTLGNNLTTPPPAPPTPWSAGYEGNEPLPAGLSGGNNNPNLSGLAPNQQASYIASQGLFGGGNGTDEQNFFSHLINNQLVPPGGNSQQGNPISSLAPVEDTYLQKLGFNTANYGNPTSLLQALSQWQPS